MVSKIMHLLLNIRIGNYEYTISCSFKLTNKVFLKIIVYILIIQSLGEYFADTNKWGFRCSCSYLFVFYNFLYILYVFF